MKFYGIFFFVPRLNIDNNKNNTLEVNMFHILLIVEVDMYVYNLRPNSLKN